MTKHFKAMCLISSAFLLLGCYPCAFLDWNCNRLTETKWYRLSEECENTQINLAKNKLTEKFNREIYMYIVDQCIDNPNYKFSIDPKYSNYLDNSK